MPDFYEIDFLGVGDGKSGDAILIRYSVGGKVRIHVVDGGFQETGESLVAHIKKYYGPSSRINSVILTHPDGDHAGGLPSLFESFQIDELWMFRPWLYVDQLIDRFSRFTSVSNLQQRFKELYPNVAKLEELAVKNGVSIHEPFQGRRIGEFSVLAPSRKRYLELLVESEKTPEATKELKEAILDSGRGILKKATDFIRLAWGVEVFPEDDTSAENNMSVVQSANLCEQKILLTGDSGRATLTEAIDYAAFVGLILPGIDKIQVPHHGSRHNVSTEILDRILGPKLDTQSEKFYAIVSSAKNDKDHPRKAVVRAFIHRGAKVYSTEGKTLYIRHNAPQRPGWSSVDPVPYPEKQEV